FSKGAQPSKEHGCADSSKPSFCWCDAKSPVRPSPSRVRVHAIYDTGRHGTEYFRIAWALLHDLARGERGEQWILTQERGEGLWKLRPEDSLPIAKLAADDCAPLLKK